MKRIIGCITFFSIILVAIWSFAGVIIGGGLGNPDIDVGTNGSANIGANSSLIVAPNITANITAAFGSMAWQGSNALNVTGGNITGLANLAANSANVPNFTCSGTANFTGATVTGISTGASFWTSFTSNVENVTASNAVITTNADMTSTILAGMPLKIVDGATTTYDIVSAINAANITVKGVALPANFTNVYYGDVSRLSVINVSLPVNYETVNSTTTIETLLSTFVHWDKVKSYLVAAYIQTLTPDSSGNGTIYPIINGSNVVFTPVNAVAANVVYDTGVSIDATKYEVAFGSNIEIGVVAGTGANGYGLVMRFLFVTP